MLQGNDFASSRPSRFYIPKANSTTRPIALLTIQDSILYQAFGNIIGRKVRPILSTLYNKATFSNQLNEPSSIYFVKPWKNSYKSYLDAEKDAFTQGLHWIAEFDFASFYDVVGHQQLIDILFSFGSHEDMLHDLQQYLSTWTEKMRTLPVDMEYHRGL
jgi:retron-type reverse transcriptase